MGERVTLRCGATHLSHVSWYYQPSQNDEHRRLIGSSSSIVVGGHSERLAFDSSLVIASVSRADAGVYICQEDAGPGLEHRLELTVRGKLKIGKVYRTPFYACPAWSGFLKADERAKLQSVLNKAVCY